MTFCLNLVFVIKGNEKNQHDVDALEPACYCCRTINQDFPSELKQHVGVNQVIVSNSIASALELRLSHYMDHAPFIRKEVVPRVENCSA